MLEELRVLVMSLPALVPSVQRPLNLIDSLIH